MFKKKIEWFAKEKNPIKFFVSIGAGINQIPLIQEAKKMGFNVIGVDGNIQAPGFIHCDLKIQESIENFKDIYTKLLELLVDGTIVGVMTKSYGIAIRSTSFLTNKFNIPFIPFDRSEDFINKKKMKSVFKEHGIVTPKLMIMHDIRHIELLSPNSFPMIIKPKIGHAKINVKLLKDVESLKKIYNENRNEMGESILEKFVEGDEIIAIGIIHERKYFLIEITDKVTTPPPYFVDIMHITPSKHDDLADNIKKIGQSIAEAFEITTSPLIMELIVDKNKDLWVIEAVPEFGGEFIPDVLIPARTNYNFILETIKAITNTGFTEPIYKKNNKNAVVVKYITGKNGTLTSCNPDGPSNIQGMIYFRIFKEIGFKVKEATTNHDRIGVVVTQGKTPEEAVKAAEDAVESLNIRIK